MGLEVFCEGADNRTGRRHLALSPDPKRVEPRTMEHASAMAYFRSEFPEGAGPTSLAASDVGVHISFRDSGPSKCVTA